MSPDKKFCIRHPVTRQTRCQGPGVPSVGKDEALDMCDACMSSLNLDRIEPIIREFRLLAIVLVATAIAVIYSVSRAQGW